MASEIAKWEKLSKAVWFYIDAAKKNNTEFRRLWSIGVRATEELGMDVFATPKTVRLEVMPNKTVVLPDDFIQYTKVGVLNSNGEIATLRYNKDISGYKILSDNRVSENAGDITAPYDGYRNYFYEDTVVDLFGVGSGSSTIGNFKIQEDEGIIMLDMEFPYNYLMLEYISAPIQDDDYRIPIQVRDAVIAYIAWRDIEYNRNYALGEKQIRRKEYYNQKRLARLRENPFRIFEANQVIRETIKLAPKA